MDVINDLGRGRGAYARRAWVDAREPLSFTDQAAPLDAEDLELLATSAYMLGRDDEYVRSLERVHRAYLARGHGPRAGRCACWIGKNLMLRREMAARLIGSAVPGGCTNVTAVAVTAGELSPIVNGFGYCGAIRGCQAAAAN